MVIAGEGGVAEAAAAAAGLALQSDGWEVRSDPSVIDDEPIERRRPVRRLLLVDHVR